MLLLRTPAPLSQRWKTVSDWVDESVWHGVEIGGVPVLQGRWIWRECSNRETCLCPNRPWVEHLVNFTILGKETVSKLDNNENKSGWNRWPQKMDRAICSNFGVKPFSSSGKRYKAFQRQLWLIAWEKSYCEYVSEQFIVLSKYVPLLIFNEKENSKNLL